MYEFPPPGSIPSRNVIDWSSLVWNFALFLVANSILFYIGRKSRQARSTDAMLILFSASFLTAFLIGIDSWRILRPSYVGLLVGLTWMIAVFVTIQNWSRVVSQQGMNNRKLVEALVGVVIAMFVSVLLFAPAIQQRTSTRWPIQCEYILINLGVAFYSYEKDHGLRPALRTGQPTYSWRVELLPYLDMQTLHRKYDFESEWNVGRNAEIAREKIEFYSCPHDPYELKPGEFAFTAFAAVNGPNSLWQDGQPVPDEDVTDGLSNTILLVEACGQRIPWASPRDIELSETEIGHNLPGEKPHHSSGLVSSYNTKKVSKFFAIDNQPYTPVLFADGSVKKLSTDIDPQVLRSLITRNGGEEMVDF